MKFTARRSDLLQDLELMASVADSSKGGTSTLDFVGLEARRGEGLGDQVLRFAATDNITALRSRTGAAVEEPGALAIPARQFRQAIRSLPDDGLIQFSQDPKFPHLIITAATGATDTVVFRLWGVEAAEFPALDAATPEGAWLQLPAAPLQHLIARTSFCVSHEASKYYLNGALLVLERRGLAMVATDGHRLAFARHVEGGDCEWEPADYLISAAGLGLLARVLEQELREGSAVDFVEFLPGPKQHHFRVRRRVIATTPITASFPPYAKVLAQPPKMRATLERLPFLAAIQRADLVTTGKTRPAALTFAGTSLRIQSSSSELGLALEDLVLQEPVEGSITIGFNARYVAEFLNLVSSRQVSVDLIDPESQAVFRPLDDVVAEFRCVLMPVRL